MKHHYLTMKHLFYYFTLAALLATACKKEDETPQDDFYLIDFEEARVLNYLAGPTSYGENLYSDYTDTGTYPRYIGYDDPCGLKMIINESYGAIDFWNGGIAVSQWNDMTTNSYLNQCSVYYRDAATSFGGYNGSKTFAIVNVANNDTRISFIDNATDCTFDHFWVTNSTYAALSMMNGDMFSKKFALGDWFKLTITACDKYEHVTGTPVEFYLADFRTASSPGIVTEWSMVDLTPLGNHVYTITFSLESSDVGDWGMNTPAYFCFDNLAIKR